MNAILDTHVLLWALSEPERLSEVHSALLLDFANQVYVSSINIVEIAIKSSIGKLKIEFDILTAVEESGFEFLDFTEKDAILLKDLPFHHKDPFDRMLIAQSLRTRFSLITDDPQIRKYNCRVV